MRHAEGGVRSQTRHDERHQDVEHGADQQRGNHADRQVTLRILGLLCRGADGIEADVGEEHRRCTTQHARPAELAPLARVGRDEWFPVRAIHVEEAEADHQQHDAGLDDHHRIVERGRLLHAAHEQRGDCDDQQHGGQVDQAVDHLMSGAGAGDTIGEDLCDACGRIDDRQARARIDAGEGTHDLVSVRDAKWRRRE